MAIRIKVRLNPESVQKAIDQLTDYKYHIKKVANQLGQALVEDGVFIAKTWIIAYDAVETGSLLNSIEGFFDASTGRGFIKANSEHAAFVEYGTGVVGKEAQASSPDKPSGWEYDVNGHGHDGWYYANGRWTKGMPPRPFMWQTWNELCERAHDEAMRYKHG